MNDSRPAAAARQLLKIVCVCLALAWGDAALAQRAPETEAEHVLLLDHSTGRVLFEKNADARMYPSSMTKMMTVYMVWERLRDGSLSLDDTFPVSRKAWRKGGSKMFVEVDRRARVEDLLRGIIVQSGNDASIVVAEGLAGTEEAFARAMTERARALGMADTQFRNASGWPDPEHYTTARDLVALATATIENFPEYYPLYAETAFSYSGIVQPNRNPLLRARYPGADGLKTGHTEAAGYGLAASAERDGRRLILVIGGLKSERARGEEAARLLDWGFQAWQAYDLFAAGEAVADIPVWMGRSPDVPAVVHDPVRLSLRLEDRPGLRVTLRYDGPVQAPVRAGDPLGEIVVTAPDMEPITVPVHAGADVPAHGPMGRLMANLRHLLAD